MGGFCPGGFCPGGFCPRGDFVKGDFVRRILSRGFVRGDFVLEPVCYTQQILLLVEHKAIILQALTRHFLRSFLRPISVLVGLILIIIGSF